MPALLINIIVDIFTNKSQKVYKLLLFSLILIVATISFLILYFGPAPIKAPWDVFLLLEGGWRITSGLIPHLDYYNPIGPLTYLLIAAGMKVGILSLSSIIYGNVFFAVLLTAFAWIIARNRLSTANTFIFSLFIFILIVCPRPLGYDVKNTTYAMIYNRYGYAMLSIYLIGLLIIPRSFSKINDVLSGFFSGVLLALMFYCKITYFLVGFVLLILFVLIYRYSNIWKISMLSGMLIIYMVMLFFFKINLSAYIADISFAAKAQSADMRLYNIFSSLKTHAFSVYLFYVILLISTLTNFNNISRANEFMNNVSIWIPVTLVLFSGMFLTSGNAYERKDMPLYFISGLILIEKLSSNIIATKNDKETISNGKITYFLGMLIIIPTFICYIFLKDVSSIGYSIIWNANNRSSLPISQRFESKRLFDFNIPETSEWRTAYWKAKNVPNRINDGINILQRNVSAGSKIFCLCFTNPFSFALGLASTRGTPLWWDENYSFNVNVYPEESKIFNEVDYIIIPKFYDYDDGCCKKTVYLMLDIYTKYIEKHFLEKDQSEYWIILKKR